MITLQGKLANRNSGGQIGVADSKTSLLATVHDCQVVDKKFPVSPHDTFTDYIITPTRTIAVKTNKKKPEGIRWRSLRSNVVKHMFPSRTQKNDSRQQGCYIGERRKSLTLAWKAERAQTQPFPPALRARISEDPTDGVVFRPQKFRLSENSGFAGRDRFRAISGFRQVCLCGLCCAICYSPVSTSVIREVCSLVQDHA